MSERLGANSIRDLTERYNNEKRAIRYANLLKDALKANDATEEIQRIDNVIEGMVATRDLYERMLKDRLTRED